VVAFRRGTWGGTHYRASGLVHRLVAVIEARKYIGKSEATFVGIMPLRQC